MPEVAPRVRRLGNDGVVNSYIVEDGGEVVIVDAAAPRHWSVLLAELKDMGRTLDDVRAVLLTHGHDDHVGFAERARQAGREVLVHDLDAALARGEVPNRVKMHGPVRPLPFLRFLVYSARHGLLRVPPVREVVTYGDGATLDLPGAPRVIHAPGHTPGNSALHFAGHDALFSGDAINTYAVTSGRRGPQLSPFNFDRDEAFRSLDRLDGVEARHVLPGHGDPWHGSLTGALAAIRAQAGGPASS